MTLPRTLPSRILVVDDDPGICAFLRDFLTAQGHEPISTTNADEAIRRFPDIRPAAVLLDVVLPGSCDGLSVLSALRRLDRDVPVIIVSGLGRTATIVQAMKLGATDVLPKPLVEADLTRLLDAVLTRQAIRRELARTHTELEEDRLPLPLVGDSDAIREVRALVTRIGDDGEAVLITGERGTGKTAIAQALHQASSRRGAFVRVNGATVPRARVEADLFGIARELGSPPRPGAIDFARGGTLFVREVADVPAPVQGRLLHLLRDGVVVRTGDRTPVPADVRLMVSTHHDLHAAAADGTLREDLLVRLAGSAVTVPPLRERRDDIVPLMTRLLRLHAVRCQRRPPAPSDAFRTALTRQDWPGNLRQLDAAMRQLVITGDEDAVLRDLERTTVPVRRAPLGRTAPQAPVEPPAPAAAAPAAAERQTPLDVGPVSLKDIARTAARGAERELILQMLTRTRWNRKEAAEILGISYKALLYKIKENGLDKAS